ncbi:MAG: RsiV family protein [Mycobacterium sp.]|nr:RsiV family protein [Mycobacterium sp.]
MRLSVLAAVIAASGAVGWPGMPVAAANPPKCSDLSGVIDGSRMCQIRDTSRGYALNISYPVDYPDQQAVVDYIKETRDGYVNVAKVPTQHDGTYELDTTATTYNSAIPPRGTQSVVFKTFQDVGGAHPQTFYKSFNWDQGLGKPITIDNLFQPGTQPFPVILPMVQAELVKQSAQPVLLPPAVGLDPDTYQNFAITNDSLIFFFSQGQVLPESAGAIQVTVPRAPIDSMLA